MSPIIPVKLQSLEYKLGGYMALRYCAPLAFFMVLRAMGYLSKEVMPAEFCQFLDRDKLTTPDADWSRPALTKLLRKAYGAPIVSWQLNGGDNIEAMKRAGYLESKREIEYFQKEVYGKSVEELVRGGQAVIVTMIPGFNTDESHNIHAVVIATWDDKEVTVFDPDARNPHTKFDPEHVRRFISNEGGGSIVLPKK